MTPKNLTDLSELTKDVIADLYFRSLGNIETRKNHVLLLPKIAEANLKAPPPSVHDIEKDFTAWYGGVLSLTRELDPDTHLPPTNQMVAFIGQNFDRAKQAIAA